MSQEKSGAEPEINAPQATKPAPAEQALRSPRRAPRSVASCQLARCVLATRAVPRGRATAGGVAMRVSASAGGARVVYS